jgi:hypothetical protein
VEEHVLPYPAVIADCASTRKWMISRSGDAEIYYKSSGTGPALVFAQRLGQNVCFSG